jgi:glucose-1-phosphate thymidylyltransferase
MKALILGAGYGVRLYPLTKNTPKPLLVIAGKPVIEWSLQKIEKIKEVSEIFIVTNQKFYESFKRWKEGYKTKKQIKIVNDKSISPDDRLGAVKDIQFVIENNDINDDLLIIAGDNLFDTPFSEIINKYKKINEPVIVLKNLKRIPTFLLAQYGIATLDEKNLITDFEEKPPDPKTSLVGLCFYIFPKNKIRYIKTYLEKGYNSDAPGYYIQWLHKQLNLYGIVVKGEWFDIGDIESYNKAEEYYKREKA